MDGAISSRERLPENSTSCRNYLISMSHRTVRSEAPADTALRLEM